MLPPSFTTPLLRFIAHLYFYFQVPRHLFTSLAKIPSGYHHARLHVPLMAPSNHFQVSLSRTHLVSPSPRPGSKPSTQDRSAEFNAETETIVPFGLISHGWGILVSGGDGMGYSTAWEWHCEHNGAKHKLVA